MLETSMGTTLNLEKEEDRSYCAATHQVGKIITHRLSRPWLYFNKIFYNFTKLGYRERQLVKILHNFTNKVIRERSNNFEKFDLPANENDEEFNYSKRKRLAMLDLLLNAKVSSGIIDDKGIQDEVNTFMFEVSHPYPEKIITFCESLSCEKCCISPFSTFYYKFIFYH